MDEPMIISDPNIMVGKPVIKGTRITVEHILQEFNGDLSIDGILEEYPHLTREGIQAALRFAMDSVRMTPAYPIHRASA